MNPTIIHADWSPQAKAALRYASGSHKLVDGGLRKRSRLYSVATRRYGIWTMHDRAVVVRSGASPEEITIAIRRVNPSFELFAADLVIWHPQGCFIGSVHGYTRARLTLKTVGPS
jgi:hypothetical protein